MCDDGKCECIDTEKCVKRQEGLSGEEASISIRSICRIRSSSSFSSSSNVWTHWKRSFARKARINDRFPDTIGSNL